MQLFKLIMTTTLTWALAVSAIPIPSNGDWPWTAKGERIPKRTKAAEFERVINERYKRCLTDYIRVYKYRPEDDLDMIIKDYSDRCEMDTFRAYRQLPTPQKIEEMKETLKEPYSSSKSPSENHPTVVKEDHRNAVAFGSVLENLALKVGHAINGLKLSPPAIGGGRSMPSMRYVP